MKTTLNLNAALLTQARALAAQQSISLTHLIEEGLQLRLNAEAARRTVCTLPVYRGQGGLAPGLSGLRHQELLDAADT